MKIIVLLLALAIAGAAADPEPLTKDEQAERTLLQLRATQALAQQQALALSIYRASQERLPRLEAATKAAADALQKWTTDRGGDCQIAQDGESWVCPPEPEANAKDTPE